MKRVQKIDDNQQKNHPHVFIDEIYTDVRNAVENEICQVDSQFRDAAKKGTLPCELELTSMLVRANEEKELERQRAEKNRR